jgi:transposase-like protein
MGALGDCKLCYRHPNRAEIDAARAAGLGVREVARRWGLSPASVSRHDRHREEKTAREKARRAEAKAKEKALPPEKEIIGQPLAEIRRIAKKFDLTVDEVLKHFVECRGGAVIPDGGIPVIGSVSISTAKEAASDEGIDLEETVEHALNHLHLALVPDGTAKRTLTEAEAEKLLAG